MRRVAHRRPGVGAARRSGFRGVGGGSASDPSDTAAYLAGDWSARTAYVSSADASTNAVAAAPAIIAVVYRIESALPTGCALLSCRVSNGGWDVRFHSNGTPQFLFHDSGGTLRTVNAPAALSAGSNIRATIVTYAGAAGSGVVRVRTDKGSWTTSASFSGYAAPAAGKKLSLGGDAGASTNSLPATTISILGFALGNTIPTDGQIDAWLDDVASQQRVMAFSQGTSWARTFKGAMSDLCARSTLTGTGGLDLSRNAAQLYSVPRISRVTSPTFGWTFTDTGAYVPSGDTVAANGKVALDATGSVAAITPQVDNQHHAYGGSQCGAFLAAGLRDVATILSGAGASIGVEVIYLALGINGTDGDTTKRQQEETDYAALLDYIYTFKPSAKVVVTTLTPTSPVRAELTAFNASLPAIWDASDYHAAGNLIRIDLSAAFNAATQTTDGLHPNDAGYALMEPIIRAGIAQAVAGEQGLVQWVAIGDSITVGSGSTDGAGWRRIFADTYWPGPWSSS